MAGSVQLSGRRLRQTVQTSHNPTRIITCAPPDSRLLMARPRSNITFWQVKDMQLLTTIQAGEDQGAGYSQSRAGDSAGEP
jgi:hypothetical protein